MDFCTEINSLLKQRNYQKLANKFYLPDSSARPDRNLALNSLGNASILPAPLDSLARKFGEAVAGLGAGEANLMGVSALQPVLNLCREFFK